MRGSILLAEERRAAWPRRYGDVPILVDAPARIAHALKRFACVRWLIDA